MAGAAQLCVALKLYGDRRAAPKPANLRGWLGLGCSTPPRLPLPPPPPPPLPPQVDVPFVWKKLLSSSSSERLIMGDDDLPYTDAELVAQVQREYEEAAALGGQESLDACFR